MSLREKGKERRRQRILDAVVVILRDEGLDQLTTSRIAEQAEVSVATLYNLIGSVDNILDAMVERMMELSSAGEPFADDAERVGDLVALIEHEVNGSCRFMAEDESTTQAVMRAIYQLNVSRGWSQPVMEAALASRDVYVAAIKAAVKAGHLSGVQPRFLAEQIITANIMLVENWAANVISIERYRISALMHFFSLIYPWSSKTLRLQLDEQLQQLQAELIKLERREKRNNKTTR